jgi:hypothetical protein
MLLHLQSRTNAGSVFLVSVIVKVSFPVNPGDQHWVPQGNEATDLVELYRDATLFRNCSRVLIESFGAVGDALAASRGSQLLL